jgi:hypothetical protein
MPTDTQTPAAGPAPRSRPAWLRTLSVAGRVVLAGAILVLGWWTISIYRELLVDQPARLPRTSTDPDADQEGVDAADLAEGVWSIAGVPWQMSMTEGERGDLLERLTEAPPAAPDGPPPKTDAAQALLLEKFTSLVSRKEPIAGEPSLEVWVIEAEPFAAAIVVESGAAKPALRAVRALYPAAEEAWALIEMLPVAEPPPGASNASEVELLPLPDAAQTLVSRHSRAGILQCILASVPGSQMALARSWEEAGWTGTLIESDSFGIMPFEWTRETKRVYVWNLSSESEDSLLFFVRGK